MLIVIGNMFGKVCFNWFFGIWMLWMFFFDFVWDKMYRVIGWFMVVGGFVMLVVVVLLLFRFVFVILLIGFLVLIFFGIVYFYFVWKLDLLCEIYFFIDKDE